MEQLRERLEELEEELDKLEEQQNGAGLPPVDEMRKGEIVRRVVALLPELEEGTDYTVYGEAAAEIHKAGYYTLLRRLRKMQQAAPGATVSDGEAAYTCDECGKQCGTPQALANHEQVHESKYVCPDCGETFDTSQALNGHRNAHRDEGEVTSSDPGNSDGPYPCTYCGDMFDTKQALGGHISQNHGKDTDAEPADSDGDSSGESGTDFTHVCGDCGARFTSKQQLATHRNKHKYAYHCGECEYAVHNPGAFYNHMENEHGVFNPDVKAAQRKVNSEVEKQ